MLRVGDVINLKSEGDLVVWLVNDSRIACAPISNIKVVPRGFYAADSVNISPTSELPAKERLGNAGLKKRLEERKDQQVMQAKQNLSHATSHKQREEGQWPVTGLIRAMGKALWSYEEVVGGLKLAGLEAAESTIHRHMRKGRLGLKPPCKISPEDLEKLRPQTQLPLKEEPAAPAPEGSKKPAKRKIIKRK